MIPIDQPHGHSTLPHAIPGTEVAMQTSSPGSHPPMPSDQTLSSAAHSRYLILVRTRPVLVTILGQQSRETAPAT